MAVADTSVLPQTQTTAVVNERGGRGKPRRNSITAIHSADLLRRNQDMMLQVSVAQSISGLKYNTRISKLLLKRY